MSAVHGSLIAGFSSLVDEYDGFILDQFGVMHNGVVALPGAEVWCACLSEHNTHLHALECSAWHTQTDRHTHTHIIVGMLSETGKGREKTGYSEQHKPSGGRRARQTPGHGIRSCSAQRFCQ